MKNKLAESLLLPYNIQFFADSAGNGGEGDAGDEDDSDEDDSDEDDSDEDRGDEKDEKKSYTQAELTAMLTKEKKEGRRALLKQLGFKSEKEAKDAVALYTALMDSQKSQQQKKEDEGKENADKAEEAMERARMAESRLSCVMAGVNKESVDDVLAIASVKVTDEKDLDKVLEEMKKNEKYSVFFNSGNNEGSGTGTPPGHGRKDGGDDGGSFGASLAKSIQTQYKNSTESPFFK